MLAPPPDTTPTGGDGTRPIGGTWGGSAEHCINVDWPSAYTWSALQYRRGYSGPASWMGSLIYESRDASGLYYRRNRYYDSEKGRFTQEDPIGLAGGLNAYGFANGDPIGYSDPYGLSPEGGVPPWLKKAICIVVACATTANRINRVSHPTLHDDAPPGNPGTFRQRVEQAGSGQTTRSAQVGRAGSRVGPPPEGLPEPAGSPAPRAGAGGGASARVSSATVFGAFLDVAIDHLTNPPNLNEGERHRPSSAPPMEEEFGQMKPLMVPKYRPSEP